MADFWPCSIFNKTARFPDKKETGLLVDINIRKIWGRFGGGVLCVWLNAADDSPCLLFVCPLCHCEEVRRSNLVAVLI